MASTDGQTHRQTHTHTQGHTEIIPAYTEGNERFSRTLKQINTRTLLHLLAEVGYPPGQV